MTAAVIDDPSNLEFPEADPNEPNKHKMTPDCAHIDLSPI